MERPQLQVVLVAQLDRAEQLPLLVVQLVQHLVSVVLQILLAVLEQALDLEQVD